MVPQCGQRGSKVRNFMVKSKRYLQSERSSQKLDSRNPLRLSFGTRLGKQEALQPIERDKCYGS